MNESDIQTARFIAHHPGCTARQIANSLQYNYAHVAQSVRYLLEQGHILRTYTQPRHYYAASRMAREL